MLLLRRLESCSFERIETMKQILLNEIAQIDEEINANITKQIRNMTHSKRPHACRHEQQMNDITRQRRKNKTSNKSDTP